MYGLHGFQRAIDSPLSKSLYTPYKWLEVV